MTAAHAAWKSYPINEGGFSVAMPSAPKSRLIQTGSKDGVLHVYEAVEASDLPSKYSVFVSQPETQGIFEHDSIDAFLKAHISSMVAAAESGKLISSSRTTFRWHPALEYKFSHSIDGVPYIARGVTLMIDGGHIRVSMWHPSEQTKSEGRFNEFLSSFKLIPIAYSPSGSQFSDPRGISFTPPKGWIQKPPQNSAQVVRFNNLTRSMQLLAAGTSQYTCENFRVEIKAAGKLKNTNTIQLGNQKFTKLTTYEDVPKYNIRLTTVQYCIDSKNGAVVLGATEEEGMFQRWAEVFEGAAATIKVQ
jgi:hypothetical protein